MKKFFLQKILPLRIPIPFTSRSIILVCEPNQIEAILASSSVHKGFNSKPWIPGFLNWISGTSFTFSVCPMKNIVAIPISDQGESPFHPERIALHHAIPMMSEAGIDVIVSFLCDKIEQREAQLFLVNSLLSNFTELKCTEDILDQSLKVKNRLKSPWHYFESFGARRKILEWCTEASETFKQVPENVDTEEFKKSIVGDLMHILYVFSILVGWDLIEELKKNLQHNGYSTENPEELEKALFHSKKVIPCTIRVVKESCTIPSLPYLLRTGDTILLILYLAKRISNDQKFTFLSCCGRTYVEDYIRRSIAKLDQVLSPRT